MSEGSSRKIRTAILQRYTVIRPWFLRFLGRVKKPGGPVVATAPLLTRHEKNPILSPSLEHAWEYGGTFNPAAWRDDSGRIHMIYRAIGADGVSRFGYACSDDGESFTRLPYPVFFMASPRRQRCSDTDAEIRRYDPVVYPSGGSWGGCEDPRMVLIDDTLYLTFSAFDGWDFIRVALITISREDFLAQRWKWSNPLFISPENEIHKNWVIFPEKIHNKFVVLHSISPRIQVDYLDDIRDLGNGLARIKSDFGCKKARSEWDTWPRGVGAPPVKTDQGWLVLYHATDKNEPQKYKLGAMILALDNPEQVLARSPRPILTPDLWYENDSKPGVVYVCGALIVDDTLSIYYGGGDRHVCIAHMPVRKLLDWIMQYSAVKT